MVTKQDVEAQLKCLGVSMKGWGAAEMQELCHILMPNEEITGYAHGWYENGFATLITTNERLLLVDKKLFHLTIEDVRYDMIAEVDFNARIFDATVRVSSVNKTLRFTSMKQRQLRALTTYVQHRVMELRQQPFSWQQFEQTPVANDAPAEVALTPQVAGAAGPGLPLQAPQLTPMRRFTQGNPYTKTALTTKHQFLPKVPRRFRPE
jgi:hypothetical protein